MNNQNICDDGALLLGYTAGSLNEEDSTRVAKHVGQCARCQEMVRGNEELVQVYRAVQSQESFHPSPEAMARLAEGEPETPDLARARAHVDSCRECLEIVTILQRVQTDLSQPTRLEVLLGRWDRWLARVRVWVGGLPSWFLSPLPAYVLVLLLVYPAYLGLVGLGGLSERLENLEAPALLSPPIALESGRERGPEEPQLEIARSGGHHVFTFFVPIAPEGHRYRVELTRSGERIFYDADAQSFDGIGTFALFVPDRALTQGIYEIRVEELEEQSGSVANVIEFGFTLTP